ncbi:MAG: EamA family transporter [Deltaproteobacteria bacterium]|jgi:transporter family protein|nr:EamA family transporter [Deltaproteobacteria bacterium]
MWFYYAILSACFASLTAITAKIGLIGINSNLATAIRTFIVLILSWSIVFATDVQNEIYTISNKNLIFLILSGLSTGLSWLCYFKALQLGHISHVAPIDKLSVVLTIILGIIFLHEPVTFKSIIGNILIVSGILMFL